MIAQKHDDLSTPSLSLPSKMEKALIAYHAKITRSITHLIKVVTLKLHLPDFNIRGKPCLDNGLLTCTKKTTNSKIPAHAMNLPQGETMAQVLGA